MKRHLSYSAATLIIFLMSNILFAQAQTDSGKVTLQLSFANHDTAKLVSAIVSRMKEGAAIPLKDVEVHFYAKRVIGLLPLGDAQTTDEDGNASVNFPIDLPGDSLGNVLVVAKVEDNDQLGDLEVQKEVKWGVPVTNKTLSQRALWASGINAPLPLVIAVTSMIALVWGIIFYLITQLFKIKKTGTS